MKARHYFKLAAKQNFAHEQCNLAYIYDILVEHWHGTDHRQQPFLLLEEKSIHRQWSKYMIILKEHIDFNSIHVHCVILGYENHY
jgi:hypothetical protein